MKTRKSKACSALCFLEESLLRSRNPFPYLFLVAFEAGSIFRAFILLLFYPIALAAKHLVSDSLFLEILVFAAVSGVKYSAVEVVSRGVLTKFYLEDMGWETYKALVESDRRYFVTSLPRVMVDFFLKEYLDAEQVIGSELHTVCGGRYCTGLLSTTAAAQATKKIFFSSPPDLGTGRSGNQLLDMCKTKLIVEGGMQKSVPRKCYLKPLIFHDGRIAPRPTPIMALAIFLWLPIGLCLVLLRAAFVVLSPHIGVIFFSQAALGVTLRFKGSPPTSKSGSLFVCSHRTVLDPIVLSGIIFRRVTALTYSISRVTEVLSPIETVRLTRCRSQDAETMRRYLSVGDLTICPEGTTCREPYLLRFSNLFVELAAGRVEIVPVAMSCTVQLFHGSSVRGWKALDPFFFALNPWPTYIVEFLEPVDLRHCYDPPPQEVANMIQKRIAQALGFQCTSLTRRDKYLLLAGNEGVVARKQRIASRARTLNLGFSPNPKDGPCGHELRTS